MSRSLYVWCHQRRHFLGPLFGRNLGTVPFRHGRDLGPSDVNMATGRAICAFFEKQNNLSTDLDPHYPGELCLKV